MLAALPRAAAWRRWRSLFALRQSPRCASVPGLRCGPAVRVAHVAASHSVVAVDKTVCGGGRGGSGGAVGLHPVSHGLHHGGAANGKGCIGAGGEGVLRGGGGVREAVCAPRRRAAKSPLTVKGL